MGHEVTLRVGAMTCASCVARVERALRTVDGVAAAEVNLATERARIQFDPARTGPEALTGAIEAAGYESGPIGAQGAEEDRERLAPDAEIHGLRRDVQWAAALTVPLVVIAMGPFFVSGLEDILHLFAPESVWCWAELVLATPVVFVSGRRFFRHGVAEIKAASPGMSTLVMLGASAAYGYSLLVLLAEGLFPEGTANLYFEAAAVIITLILLGKYLARD